MKTMMQLYSLLLFISVADLVLCHEQYPEVKFPAEILQRDLEAIELYHKNIETLNAYIHWPTNIDIRVEGIDIKGKHYLKIEGGIKVQPENSPISSYVGLLYRNGKFHTKDIITRSIKDLPSTATVHYEQHFSSIDDDAYLSIRYTDLEELKAAFEPFYTKHQHYLETCRKDSPSTFLLTFENFADRFLEFTTWKESEDADIVDKVDTELLTLIGGQDGHNRVTLARNGQYERLVFDQNSKTFVIPAEPDTVGAHFVKRVFGVRMAHRGFIAEIRGEVIKFWSSRDLLITPLNGLRDEPVHSVDMRELLDKSMKTEPKNCDLEDEDCWSHRPKSGKFQIQGHLLVKRVNFKDEGEIVVDETCPFVIEYYNSEASFMFGNTSTKQICSNNSDKLWAGKEEFKEDGRIVLMYGSTLKKNQPPKIK